MKDFIPCGLSIVTFCFLLLLVKQTLGVSRNSHYLKRSKV
nr:MAG TPA: hypothetical protein [Caudoviricetes sp.]